MATHAICYGDERTPVVQRLGKNRVFLIRPFAGDRLRGEPGLIRQLANLEKGFWIMVEIEVSEPQSKQNAGAKSQALRLRRLDIATLSGHRKTIDWRKWMCGAAGNLASNQKEDTTNALE